MPPGSMDLDGKDMLPMVRRFSTASVKATPTTEPDETEEMDRRRPQLRKSKSWANGLAASPPPVPKLAIPIRPQLKAGRVEPVQEPVVISDDPAGDSSPKPQDRPKRSMLPSWMRHLIDKANEIMRPAAKEYFRDTTDYTKRLGLDRAEVEGLMQSGMQARRNSLTPAARLPRSRTVASLDSQELWSPARQLADKPVDQKVRRDSHAGTSSRRLSSTPAPRIIRSRTVASFAALDSQELNSLQKDARRVRRNRGSSDR
ncbi:unnamed protein product [Symbiodinium natans]|uniref:Uncharacterized protein n=1 Tax=Symbiodinium natans TaxID=878477 RepID=A0A812TU86_9DINO|nr:unnamed protein product [Symbiodinium natans]